MKQTVISYIIIIFLTANSFAQNGIWTWMKGDSITNSMGQYGIQGLPNSMNTPPALYQANGWVDLHGNFWLYGGRQGVNFYSDLWKYDISTNMWTWIKGPGTPNHTAVFGIQGYPSIDNSPGDRGDGFLTWTDLEGNLWLFGGNSTVGSESNDLWRYSIISNEWTWMKGTQPNNYSFDYGTINNPSPSNNPPARKLTRSAWVDYIGNLWFFGGMGYGDYNDLWRYDISTNNWTWIKGSNVPDQPGHYGIQLVEDSMNTPGARSAFAHWKDSDGNFWLFGGMTSGPIYIYNDLWKYNVLTNNWSWMSGSSLANQQNNCSGICQSLTSNIPSGRIENSACWKGLCDYLFFYGGVADAMDEKYCSDMWCYDVANSIWTFTNGNLAYNVHANHGTILLPSSTNHPGSLKGSCSWTDLNGNFWLFGGVDSSGFINDYTTNELWRYTPDTNCPIGQIMTSLSVTNDTLICPGDSIQLVASGGDSYLWSPVTNISNPNVFNPYVYPDSATTYSVTIFKNNCKATLTVTVKISNDTILYLSNSDTIICQGDTVKLHVIGSNNCHWFPNYNITEISSNNPIVYPDTTTIYTVLASNNCLNKTLDVKIIVIADSTKRILNNDTSVCSNTSITLSATGGEYLWSNGQSNSTIIINPLVDTSYFVTITDNYGCKSIDSVMIKILSLPVITVTPSNPYLCYNHSIFLNAQGAATFNWSPNLWISTTHGNIIEASPLESITYLVIGQDSNSCLGSLNVTISMVESPISSLPDSLYICDRKPLVINAGNEPNYSYLWQDGTLGSEFPVYDTGVYFVAIQNIGCKIYDTIYISSCPKLWIPNAFSPNGDGINELFFVFPTSEVSLFKMEIINRWGDRVFYTESINTGWDGAFNGVDCLSDVYTIIIRCEFANGYRISQTVGKLILVR